MKRLIVLFLALGVLTSSMVTAQAGKAKPIKTTFYFHGGTPVGELEIPDGVSGIWRKMDTTEPTDPAPKSFSFAAAGAAGSGTPNSQCAGSPFFPVWVGAVNGQIVGDLKLSLDVISSPAAKVDVRVWGHSNMLACNEAYVPPAAEVRVDMPAGSGTLEAVFKRVKFPAQGQLMVQVTPVLDGPTAARVLYDSTSFISQLEFSCIPTSGKSCV